MSCRILIRIVPLLVAAVLASSLGAQDEPAAEPADLPAAGDPESIVVNAAQGPALVHHRVYATATPENVSIRIVLGTQRAYFLVDGAVAIDTPISTGTKAHPTPRGGFTITQKKLYHNSTLYGDYVDRKGRVVLAGVSSRRNKAPPGTRFRGTPVPYWQRLTEGGVGMHVGKLPGYPASHGCLRFPSTVMPLIYAKTKVGTPVTIE